MRHIKAFIWGVLALFIFACGMGIAYAIVALFNNYLTIALVCFGSLVIIGICYALGVAFMINANIWEEDIRTHDNFPL